MSDVDGGLHELVFQRVTADPKLTPRAQEMVLAAFEGDEQLRSVIGGGSPNGAVTVEPASPHEPAKIYLRAIRVEGFRGVGPKQELSLEPGPGLTVITGRNGSGKSSFAEAAQLVLTGGNDRWDKKKNNKALLRQGWRNLHARTPTTIEVDIVATGEPGPVTVRMAWPGGDYNERQWTRQRDKARRETICHGWLPGASTHEPFLSYGELGALIDSTPTELHDRLHSLLGLGDLDVARDLLREERRPFDARIKKLKEDKDTLLAALAGLDDGRARQAEVALRPQTADLESLAALALGDDADAEQVGILRGLSALSVPDFDVVHDAAQAVGVTTDAVRTAATPEATTAMSITELLDQALAHHDRHGDAPCPVCGVGATDAAWRERAIDERERLRAAAEALEKAQRAQVEAVRRARLLAGPPPAILSARPHRLDPAPARRAWEAWHSAASRHDPMDLADVLLELHAPLVMALQELRDAATAELVRLDERWRPVAARLLAWHDDAQRVAKEKPMVADLKQAYDWLRVASGELRNERIAPFAAESQRIWATLRQESSVNLGSVQLAGSGNLRKLVLGVTVDGSDASALSVMSQGELHALGLSLFLPRATVSDSPFGFVMTDDPVQAMDPAKVEGLAQVLADLALTRQVVAFSHDDRLADAVRRLSRPATIWQVRRREDSRVDLVRGSDPVARYIADAKAILDEKHMPAELRRELIATCCRGALEASAHAKVRSVRLGRGERHDDVEDLLARARTTHEKVTLALFDDPKAGDKLLPYLDRKVGGWAADTLRACKEGAHRGGFGGDLASLVRNAGELSAWIRP